MKGHRKELILKLGANRLLAHQALFKHRHSDSTPPFHSDVVKLWHSRLPAALVMVFREGGKSTIAEEAFVIGGAYQLFHNAIIIGATERRAIERLRAIKHEFETNELLAALFGPLVGPTWNEAEIILGNGVRITALGRGQSLRGTKHLHYRPDFCFCDDIEEKEHVATPEARDETLTWFMSVVIPALDKNSRIRVNATPLHREALPFALKNAMKWPAYVFPIEYIDETNRRRATWEARYPLDWIDQKKAEFESVGKLEDYYREYMCVAEDPRRKVFTAAMFKVEPKPRSWHPVWACFDPARSTGAASATTGWAVWSWIANRLVVWDGGGDLWKPDEIVAKIFEVAAQYTPIAVGVERDGLEEFLLQPLRHEMIRRGMVVPVLPMKAPKGKFSFIEGLQPFFAAGEVTFAKELSTLRGQFLNYPTGRIDGPNALAYALPMRPGAVVYEDFSADHVGPVVRSGKTWLCLNSRHGYVTAVAVEFTNGRLAVVADYVREGDPGTVAEIVQEAALEAKTLSLVAPRDHWSAYNHLGLRGAVAKIPAELHRGAATEVGRDEIRALLRRQTRGEPSFRVDPAARWTLNALAAGYAREIGRNGMLSGEAREGVHRILIEGLEAFAGLLRLGIMQQGRPNIQRTASGQVYISALPGAGVSDDKDTFLAVGGAAGTDTLPARR